MDETPKDFLVALKENGLADFFSYCTKARCREYLKWIGEAKRPETRTKRISQAVKMISKKSAEEVARSKKESLTGSTWLHKFRSQLFRFALTSPRAATKT
jgi:Bacteriocin-protection, YdeI or OmpD-Associated